MGSSIAIEINAGTAIERAAEDAQRIADLLGITCEFRFNDVVCFAQPGGSADILARRQQFEQARKLSGPFDRKFASSHLRVAHASDDQPKVKMLDPSRHSREMA